jgi:16S rRNA (guanine527-N7)-methyltransferase
VSDLVPSTDAPATSELAAARARLIELAARLQLPPRAADQLDTLLVMLAGDPRAPTGVTEPARVLEEHLADSLVALELDQVRAASTIADLGSGAGVPGLPLAVALPCATVSLIESNARKCAFIQRALSAAAIANAYVVHVRAESWRVGLRRHDLIVARALAPLAVVLEYAAPLLRAGGSVVVWRGRRDEAAEAAAARAAVELGLGAAEIRRVRPYSGARERHLYLVSKVAETPARFPRREGVALKRPLGTAPSAAAGRVGLRGASDRDQR